MVLCYINNLQPCVSDAGVSCVHFCSVDFSVFVWSSVDGFYSLQVELGGGRGGGAGLVGWPFRSSSLHLTFVLFCRIAHCYNQSHHKQSASVFLVELKLLPVVTSAVGHHGLVSVCVILFIVWPFSSLVIYCETSWFWIRCPHDVCSSELIKAKLINLLLFTFLTGSRSSGSNPSAGKGRRSSPQEKGQRSTCSESEPCVRGGRRGDRCTSQMSHHSHAISSHSHARSGLSLSHRSHSQNSHPPFTYTQAPFTQQGPGSCAQSERSHASSYGPPGLPPPYCLARLAPKTPVSSSTPPGAPPGRELAAVPPELTASRQSFQHAMGNPCEFFVDIMWQGSAFKTHPD